ncbi:hypothetical protein PMAYCL1PPCAC_10796, partial [Pristionchus mayeri]
YYFDKSQGKSRSGKSAENNDSRDGHPWGSEATGMHVEPAFSMTRSLLSPSGTLSPFSGMGTACVARQIRRRMNISGRIERRRSIFE